MDIIDDYKQLRMIEILKEYNNMKVCYKENLKLCKWQEQQINRLATAIEKIDKILKVYFDDDNRATREIEQIIQKLIKEQTNEK
jgi:hypothetical protein